MAQTISQRIEEDLNSRIKNGYPIEEHETAESLFDDIVEKTGLKGKSPAFRATCISAIKRWMKKNV